ncbi:hypothetical protein K1T71_008337 [Dendrolimus kikuchii]|uniref:Uncharacterized protein n=1 Tax=Dendrolimus kikuchii TaxID=765133 RepID=A0ACC1CWY1_9NEOP|nr:hypothetical protein K1T71_008337 [Dendrolimus kikuchii]
MDFVRNLVFYFCWFYFISLTVCTDDTCQPLTSCSCEFSNGTGIDLTPAEKSTFYSTQNYKLDDSSGNIELHTYYYHPCYDATMPVPGNATESSTCSVPLSICRHVNILTHVNGTVYNYTMSPGTYDFIGKTDVSKFSSNGDAIIYVSTTVLLVCAQSEDALHIVSLDDPQKLVLSFHSRSACLKQIDTGRSIGSTLVIVFFSCLIFYLVLGICTKKFLMGATGIEVVPNLAFWSDLPNLVKDGWAFMISGFKLPARAANGIVRTPDPNSYDSI